MEAISDKSPRNKSDLKFFILTCLFACLPVYWASLFYIEIVTNQEIEELAVAVTIAFLIFFYIGWSLPPLWTGYNKKVLQWLRMILTVLMLACIIWLFAHADIQLHHMPAINLFLFWMPFIILSASIGALVNLVRIQVRTQLLQANITAEQSRSELNLLQSQLSPHFLFNTLNNLYGLSITQHQKIPILLLKLSDLLRYSVYDAKELFVPLKDEVTYINNYIDFEKIRIGDRLSLVTSIEPMADDLVKIAPMLLIVFIENAFKHSKNTMDEKIYIEIELKRWSDRILFSIKNSYGDVKEKSNKAKMQNGLGLANVRKRLQLLYMNDYDLKADASNGFYKVTLQLKVK
jgi:hypothetical protein